MARDYKHRANSRKKKTRTAGVPWWRWLGVFILIALFVYFLFFLSNAVPKVIQKQQTKTISLAKVVKKKAPPKRQDKAPKEPEFNFYTILTEEVVVPDYEIHTRSREEKIGKLKETKYIMQVGSFRELSEADKLRAHLALLGIESRIEKATVGGSVWNRVRMGPFESPSNVADLKKRLKENGIDTKVTEIKR
jgi:cell division protein FtsN